MAPVSAPLRRLAYALILVLVVEYLVVPQLAGARRALVLLAEVKFRYIFLGIGLEAASIVAYALLTRGVLPRTANAPSLWTLIRIQMSTLAVSHVVPGGAAAGNGLG